MESNTLLKRTPRGGRFLYPVSDQELERRWALTREVMKRNGVDLLVVQNEGQDLGGYVRWLSDVQAGYPETIIFQMEDGMITINSSGFTNPLPPAFMRRGISRAIGKAYFRTVDPTKEVDAEIAVEEIRKTGKKNIGLVNLGRMHASFYNRLTRDLSGCNFTDITDDLDYVKAIKSEEELEVAQAVCDLEDAVMAEVPSIVRPGRKELDVRNDIHDMCLRLGAEGQFFLTVSSSPMNTICGQFPLLYEGKTIKENENVSVLIESSGPGGFFGEMQRTICTGEPSRELIYNWEKAVEVQKICAEMLVPEGDPVEVFRALNRFLEKNGFAKEERLFAHGQGYDLIERPALMPGETMKFAENMFVVLHPTTVNRFGMCTCADNFLVTPKGGVRMHKTPQKIFIAGG